jgi:hypothetical protein
VNTRHRATFVIEGSIRFFTLKTSETDASTSVRLLVESWGFEERQEISGTFFWPNQAFCWALLRFCQLHFTMPSWRERWRSRGTRGCKAWDPAAASNECRSMRGAQRVVRFARVAPAAFTAIQLRLRKPVGSVAARRQRRAGGYRRGGRPSTLRLNHVMLPCVCSTEHSVQQRITCVS